MLIATTEKIMRNAFIHFAKKADLEPKQVQILISAKDESGEPKYTLMHDFKTIKMVSFNEILDVSFDLMGRESLAKPFLKDTLNRFSKELNEHISNIHVMIYNNGDTENNPILCLYNGPKTVKLLDIEKDVFI